MTWQMRTWAVVLVVAGLAACSDDAGTRDDAAPSPTPQESTAAPLVGGDPILIEERITDARAHTGVVLDTSLIGESRFCADGTSSGGSSAAVITETFACAEGTLTIRFAPTQPSLVQGATWEVVSGTGSFADMRGGGTMVSRFGEDDPDSGLVTFTGTVGR